MKDRIIIIKVIKYLDHHLIVTGLTTSGAKKSFLAPAALKSKKRFGGGVLEPTHFVEVQYSDPKSEGQLSVLKEAFLIDAFDFLREDYDKIQSAFQMLKSIDKVAHEELIDDGKIFSLLGHGLKALKNAVYPHYVVSHFEMKLLHVLGVLEPDESLSAFLSKKFDQYPICDEQNLSSNGWSILNGSKREYL